MPDISLLWLIFVAILVGYFLGWHTQKKKSISSTDRLAKDYFVGLNYLINERTDEAIDVFIKALHLENDTVDTYLALAGLFGKRGEVDKSIHIHQDLLARPGLTPKQSVSVQLALASNYFSAGLLDRAEAILVDISRSNHSRQQEALQQLLKVYEQEREWESAIHVAERLRKGGNDRCKVILAHYYCEQAMIFLHRNDHDSARVAIRNALSRDRNSVRSNLLLGKIEFEEERYKEAIKVLQRISTQDLSFVPLSIPMLELAFDRFGNHRGLRTYLTRCLKEQPGSTVSIAMTRLLLKESGEQVAINFLMSQLDCHPTLRELHELISIRLRYQGEVPGGGLQIIQQFTQRMLALKPVFSCDNCGFSGKDMHWQCPSCHSWGTVKPIQGLEGD